MEGYQGYQPREPVPGHGRRGRGRSQGTGEWVAGTRGTFKAPGWEPEATGTGGARGARAGKGGERDGANKRGRGPGRCVIADRSWSRDKEKIRWQQTWSDTRMQAR